MQSSTNPQSSDLAGNIQVPSASALSRIGALDFLTVLPSGVFTFLVTYLVGSGDSSSASQASLWDRVELLVGDTLGNPLILLCVLFVSYFFGSVLRAFPAEWLVANLHIGRRRCPRRRATDRTPGGSRKIQFRVKRGRNLTPRRPDVIPKSIVDGWKNTLNHRSPEAYAYFKTVEAKSRFAAAMLWAGVVGLACSGSYMAVVGSNAALSELALISMLLTVVFGSQLPKVCRQEVSALLTLSEATR